MENQDFLNTIRSNINNHGFHVTIVKSGITPRFAYTIGVTDILNCEFIFAGGAFYLKDELLEIFTQIVKDLKEGEKIEDQKLDLGTLGVFELTEVKSSWSKLMILGVFDYYKTASVKAFQIVPDPSHFTRDIPDMSNDWTSLNPVWRWLVDKWEYSVPEMSTVVTNLDALFGEEVTEVMRWEVDEWEMFAGAGPDVEKDEIRVVSLGTMLGIDKTLLPTLNLEIGKGLWRESSDSEWNSWGD